MHAVQRTDARQESTTKKGCVKPVEIDTSSISTQTQEHAAERAPVTFVGVKNIKPAGHADVYNMEVESHHNFAVNGGTIVHNCIDSARYATNLIWRKRGM